MEQTNKKYVLCIIFKLSSKASWSENCENNITRRLSKLSAETTLSKSNIKNKF